MNSAGPESPRLPSLERYLAVAGAVACLVITVLVWRSVSAYQEMWPLPALYFIEIAALSTISGVRFVVGGAGGRSLMWAAVGVLGAFSVLGMFSVGLLYAPIVLLFAGASLASDVRNRHYFPAHLAICLLGAFVQAALMLSVVRWLEAGAGI